MAASTKTKPTKKAPTKKSMAKKAAPKKAVKTTSAKAGADNGKHVETVGKYVGRVDKKLVDALAKTYRLALSKPDSRYVACGQEKELKNIRTNFLKKKLGLTQDDEKLDKAIQDVCETMGKRNPKKSRLAFYYLLTTKFKSKSVFVPKDA